MSALYQRDSKRVDELLAGSPNLDLFECAALGRTGEIPEDADLHRRSADGFTALHLACFFGNADTARTLIARGADVHASADNPSQVQPLHSAVAAQSREIVSSLLAGGAQPNARQQGGWTPLHAAVKLGNVEIVRDLLEHGASQDLVADNGQSALDFAKGHPEIMGVLKSG